MLMGYSVLPAQGPSSGPGARWWARTANRPPLDASKLPFERLLSLRAASGIETAAEAARQIGTSVVTYQHHENGNRGISPRAASIYGRFYGVSGGVILYGEPPPHGVLVAGEVAAGGRIAGRMESARSLPWSVPAPVPASGNLHALVIGAGDLYPAYRAGDVVFYADTGAVDPALIAGRECIVETAGGDRLLRLCHLDPAGTWTLHSYNLPPVHGVVLVTASPVLWVQRSAVAQDGPQ